VPTERPSIHCTFSVRPDRDKLFSPLLKRSSHASYFSLVVYSVILPSLSGTVLAADVRAADRRKKPLSLAGIEPFWESKSVKTGDERKTTFYKSKSRRTKKSKKDKKN